MAPGKIIRRKVVLSDEADGGASWVRWFVVLSCGHTTHITGNWGQLVPPKTTRCKQCENMETEGSNDPS